MPSLAPTVSGSVESYSVTPALPDGVAIDSATGVIAGTPGEDVNHGAYVITARNAGGSAAFTLTLNIAAKEATEHASEGTLAFDAAINPKRFVSVGASVTIRATGASLSTTSGAVRIFRNGQQLEAAVDVTSDAIRAGSILAEGRNDIVVLATDTTGHSLSLAATLWAGSQTLAVNVRTEAGTAPGSTTVVAKLSDDDTVGFEETTSTGRVLLHDVPNRTILLSANATANRFATLTTVGGAGTVTLQLAGFKSPSDVANNDFSQGFAGWEVGTAGSASLVPHTETIEPGTVSAATASASASLHRAARALSAAQTSLAAAPKAHPLAAAAAATGDMDLQLSTVGEGPRSVSRTFNVAPGTSRVMVRYRFITSEVPGGYFGSGYNDSYAVSIRSLQGGGSVSDSHSMNGLGLAAFDAGGSTAWKTLSLPVSSAGDTVQFDLTVTNVGDDLYDSSLVVDAVAEESLSVAVSAPEVCPNETVTYTASGGSASEAAWAGGGAPASGSGTTFATRYVAAGDYTGTATAGGKTATAPVRVKEASGAAWVARFPTSTNTADLASAFQVNVDSFIAALRAAGATVSISATYRPAERAYLMHYSYRIAKQGLDPASVPRMVGVEICWVHRSAQGAVDNTAARFAAQQMVNAYGIAYAPALQSRHTERLAIDMSISWTGNLTILGAHGEGVSITSEPRTGGNTTLHQVGAGYSVIKLVSDPPHWSDDGH
ncbi:MAG: putative Ig domain-containing protein [Roseateles sp.]|uniref:putative Ig domain-containing protein n=1 Tax=Roseateles sp. TaxID=1971397 RepID=UPI0039ECE367